MALNDMRALIASPPVASNATSPALAGANPVREVSRRADAAPDFAQVMAQRQAEHAASERAASDRAASDRAASDRAASDRAASDRAASDRSAADAAARRDGNDAADRNAQASKEPAPASRANDDDSASSANTGAATASAASVANGSPATSTRSGAANDRSQRSSTSKSDSPDDQADDTSADAAAAAVTATGAKDLANALAAGAALNPAALAAAGSSSVAAGAGQDDANSAPRGATDALRGAHTALRATAALVPSDASAAVPAERAAGDATSELAAALDNNRGDAAVDGKRGNAKRDVRPDTALDAQAVATDAPRAAAGARDRLLEDFEQRFAKVLSAAADISTRAEGHHAAAPLSNTVSNGGAFGAALNAMGVASPTVAASIAVPVTQPGFGGALGDQIVLLAHQRVAGAQITVTPADLGPITIGIEMHGQDANLNFTATHPATRAAIEDALPRLRDMFASNGLNLAQANVGGETRRDPDRSQRGSQGNGSERTTGIDAITAAPAAATRVTVVSGAPRLIDIRV